MDLYPFRLPIAAPFIGLAKRPRSALGKLDPMQVRGRFHATVVFGGQFTGKSRKPGGRSEKGPGISAQKNSRYSIHIEYLPPSKNITNVNTINIMNPACVYKPDAHKEWEYSQNHFARAGAEICRGNRDRFSKYILKSSPKLPAFHSS